MSGHSLAAVRDSDVGEMARIHALCFDEAWNGRMLRRILAMPGTGGIVARSDLRWSISGFAVLRIAADECELLTLAVAPEKQGAGVGSVLFGGALARAAGRGARALFLEVAEDNEAARRLYERYGLHAVGRRPDYYARRGGERVAALTMSCRLDVARRPGEPAIAAAVPYRPHQ